VRIHLESKRKNRELLSELVAALKEVAKSCYSTQRPVTWPQAYLRIAAAFSCRSLGYVVITLEDVAKNSYDDFTFWRRFQKE
jgi:hypothetical protein